MESLRISCGLRRATFVALAAAGAAVGQPAVDAGDDQLGIALTDAISGSMRLMGDVSEPYDSVRWSQTSGTTASITNPVSPITAVTLPDTGAYTFRLLAYLNGQGAQDSVRFTVRPNLPFTILTPAEGSQVRIGAPCMVRWQMDPSIGCLVYWSVDGGVTENLLNTGGGVKDSMLWEVPADVVDGAQGTVKVMEYTVKPNRLATTASFTLVDTILSARPQPEGSARMPLRVVVNSGGAVTVIGLPDAGIALFDLRGRNVSPWLRARERPGSVLGRAVYGCRFAEENSAPALVLPVTQ